MRISRREGLKAVAATAAIGGVAFSQAARAQVNNRIRLIVLDIGGTIIEDHGEVPTAMHDALARRGIEASAGEIAEWRGASKREMVRHFVQLRTGVGNPSLISTIYDDFTRQVNDAYAHVRPIAGAEAVMDRLRREGYVLATTTGFDGPLTRTILGRLGWQSRFVASITSDDVVVGRPAPFMLFHAMEAARIDNVAIVMAVGDTPLDLQAGNNAGLGAVIGVYSGAATKERLQAEKSTWILPSVASLPDLLASGSPATPG
jgi:phosphonatase-like hydrolase